MTAKLLESLISAAIGGGTSFAVAYLQIRMNRRWSRSDQAAPSGKPEE